MKYKRKFYPEGRYIFNVAFRDKDYRDKMAQKIIRNNTTPFKNELFSSWIARNATINFLQTPSFVNYFFPEYKNRLLNRDADLFLDEKMSLNFSRRMLMKPNDIFNTSLKSYQGYLAENITSNTRNNLISPVKIKGTYPAKYGLKYCPMCLKEKEYFRKEWRLSFYTVCLKHQCFLVDSCPNCKEPLLITKRKLDIESFNCWNCGYIFKNSEVEHIDKNSKSLLWLNRTMQILDKGYFQRDGHTYYSIVYFIVLKHIAKIIYQYGYRNIYTLQKELELYNIVLQDIEYTKGKFLEEHISLKEAFAVFTACFEIMGTGRNFDRFAKANKIPISILRKDISYMPFWYDRLTEKYYKYNKKPALEEIKSAILWMINNNMSPSYCSLSRLFDCYLDKKNTPEITQILLPVYLAMSAIEIA